MTDAPSLLTSHTYEAERVQALQEFDILHSSPEAAFDSIVALAATLFDMPYSLISLVGAHDHVAKAASGIAPGIHPREDTFCFHMLGSYEPLIVEDAAADPRFANNPFVVGEPYVRFYAGAPLVTSAGYVLGAVCIADVKPRTLDRSQIEALKTLADIVMDRFTVRRKNRTLEVSHRRFENMCETSPSAILCADERGYITFFNKAAEEMFDYPVSEAIGNHLKTILPLSLHEDFDRDFQEALSTRHSHFVGHLTEAVAIRRDGSEFPARFGVSMWPEGNGFSFGILVINLSERKRTEAELTRLAHFDQLTGLPNRHLFMTQVAANLEARSADRSLVLLLNLIRFKDLNDAFGHAAGDLLLAAVGERIQKSLQPGDILARLGGDEFAIFRPGLHAAAESRLAARSVTSLFDAPFVIHGQVFQVEVSVGIAMAPDHGRSIERLLAAADLALSRAKTRQEGPVALFDRRMLVEVRTNEAIQADLRRAYENDEFEIYFQPQVCLRDGSIVGAEVLLRWNHPVKGLLSPNAFLPILDRMPLAATVGWWVLERALAQAQEWRARGLGSLRIGVNLFEAQFHTKGMANRVLDVLRHTATPPDLVELEVTETIAIKRYGEIEEGLRVLQKAGLNIAFDDFGTGYASLSLLKRFPLTRLKIDQSFVRDIASSSEDRAIVDAVINLGETFGLDVIAEGIETAEQEHILIDGGCIEGQGYRYGRPMPARQFEDLLVTRRIADTILPRVGLSRGGL